MIIEIKERNLKDNDIVILEIVRVEN